MTMPPMLEMAARVRLRVDHGDLAGARRLLVFATALGAGAAALWLLVLTGVRQPAGDPAIPWWLLLLGCYLGSVMYVPVRVHRVTSTVSLTEIPVVVGLFTVDPRVLLGCYVGGVLLGNWSRRGLRPALDVANLMLDALYMGTTVLVFHAAGAVDGDPLATHSLLALAAAMAAAGWCVGPVAVNLGIWLYQGAIDRGAALRAAVFQAAATLTNTCLGLVMLVVVVYRPVLALAMLPPIAAVFAGQLAATEGQSRAARMAFLYRTNELLHSVVRMSDRYADLLDLCMQTFAVKRAELIIIPDSREPAVRFFVSNQALRAPITSAPLTLAEQETINALRDERVLSGRDGLRSTPMGLLLEERAAKAGTAVLLRGQDRVLGMLLLVEPLNGTARLSRQERTLLSTVADQVSVAMEHGQLADAVRALAAEKEELTRKALHDPLTQLPNRSLFVETVSTALSRLPASMRYLAVLFIDLDGFKQVNDSRGHAAGDQVLCAAAARLRQQLRKHDLAARFGGDEFALLLDGLRQPEDATLVASRVVELLQSPIPLEGAELRLGGSVGVAVVSDHRRPHTAEELVHRADMAMYLAKRQGKGRFVVFDPGARDPVLVDGDPQIVEEAAPAAS